MKLLREYIREATTSQANTGGDCYEAAGKHMFENCAAGCDLTLVHGEVAGQGALEGMTYGHAWVLDGGTVIDRSNGRNLQLPQAIYYALGQIDQIGNIVQYSWPDAREKIVEYEHWGPWELETESGL